MKELNLEDVKAYIEFETTNISKKKQILSHLYLDVLLGIPTAFFGIYSDITSIRQPSDNPLLCSLPTTTAPLAYITGLSNVYR